MADEDKKTDSNEMINEGKLEEWMYDFAWKGRDAAMQGIDILDNKAMSLINFSSVLITILAGVLFFIKDKGIDTTISIKASAFIIGAIILFIVAIIYAFFTIRIRKHGILPVNKQFEVLTEIFEKNSIEGDEKIKNAMGKTAHDLGDWQCKLIKISREKSKDFNISSLCFVLALVFVLVSSLLIAFYI